MADRILYRGETAVFRELVKDQDGVVKDLSAGSVSFRIGNERENVFVFSKEGALTSDGTDGLIQVEITAADSITEALTVGRTWDYQFIVTDVDGDIQVVKQGTIEIKNILPAS